MIAQGTKKGENSIDSDLISVIKYHWYNNSNKYILVKNTDEKWSNTNMNIHGNI